MCFWSAGSEAVLRSVVRERFGASGGKSSDPGEVGGTKSSSVLGGGPEGGAAVEKRKRKSSGVTAAVSEASKKQKLS